MENSKNLSCGPRYLENSKNEKIEIENPKFEVLETTKTMANKFECGVCVEEKKVKEKVACPCGFDVCQDCSKQYLLNRLEDAHCMSCKTGWTLKFLIDTFGKGWAEGNKEGQWRHYRKSVALDREKSRLPEALAELPKIKARERAIAEAEKLCADLRGRLDVAERQVRTLRGATKKVEVVTKPYTKKIKDFPSGKGVTEEKARELLGYRRCKIPEGMFVRTTNAKTSVFKPNRTHRNWATAGIYMGPIKHRDVVEWLAKKAGKHKRVPNDHADLMAAHARVRELKNLIYETQDQSRRAKGCDDPALASPNFLCPCPIDECKGMIESKGFSCVKCEKKVCRRCREPKEKDDGHKCDPQVLENIKFLRDDTKPCPTCATPIHKLGGCDQMFCMTCKTAFSWRTGKLETGTIHNPHAIQWQREHGGQARDLNDIPCGGLIEMRMIEVPDGLHRKIEPVHRVVAEIDNRIIQPNNDFSDLRLNYVQDRMDEKRWRQNIFLRERENARRSANADIYVTLRTLAIERFRDLAENVRGKQALKIKQGYVDKFLGEMEEIRTFVNKAFMSELPPLGTKKPAQVVISNHTGWMWLDAHERQEKRIAQDPNYLDRMERARLDIARIHQREHDRIQGIIEARRRHQEARRRRQEARRRQRQEVAAATAEW